MCASSIYAHNINDESLSASNTQNSPLSSVNNDVISSNEKNVLQAKNTDKSSFSNLANEIQSTDSDGVLYLDKNFKYTSSDSQYRGGIPISDDIHIKGNGHYIDGSGKTRILKIRQNCKVVLENIVFKNGYSSGKFNNGGAIVLMEHSSLTIKNCVFKNNVAYKSNGGAIATGYYTKLNIQHSKFLNNKAVRVSSKPWPNDIMGLGGAIEVHVGSKLKLTDSTFKGNSGFVSTVLVMSYSEATGIKTSTVNVKGCLFEKNKANINGAFYLDEYGKGSILKTKFKKNTAKEGGALVLDASKSALVKDCTFERNTGKVGAGISVFKFNNKASKVKIEKCSFKNNYAKFSGGAIYSDCGKVTVTNSKFTGNKAALTGGSIYIMAGSLVLKSCIFKNNKAKNGAAIIVHNKNFIVAKATKFINNIASDRGGQTIYGLTNGRHVNIKIKH